MQKAEAQHNQVQNQSAVRQGKGASVESPQGEQIAQLEAMMDSSPQAGKLAQLAETANNSPQASAQRRMMDMIHNSSRMAAQRKAISAIHNSPNVAAQRQQIDSLTGETTQSEEAEESLQPKVTQREAAPAKPNNTGLPDNLKAGIENLSGMSMDSVRVHYNSSQPAQLNALAYAQGSDIHVAPGQEQHLPHEAWHVVQQAQGRVQPTMQMKDGVPVNDDAGLEHEADVMGARAGLARFQGFSNLGGSAVTAQAKAIGSTIQRAGTDQQFMELSTLYPAVINHRNTVDNLADEVWNALIESYQLATLVGRWSEFMQLSNYLGSIWGGANAYAARVTTLLNYNRLFGTGARTLPILANQFADFQVMLAALDTLAPVALGHAITAGVAYLLPRSVAATSRPLVMRMIAENRRTGGQAGLIAINRLGEIEGIFQAYSPGGFAGFASWGDGNHASSDENVQEHFLKHVCYVVAHGHTAPPLAEIGYWWNQCGLNPSLQYVLGYVAPKQLPSLNGELVAQFGGGYAAAAAGLHFNPATAGQVTLFAYLVDTYPSLASDLLTTYLNAYEQAAIAGSAIMTNAQVHLSQGDYFVSGVNGPVYIVARVENNVAAISSAYWCPNPHAKVASATQERLWTL